MKNETYIGKLNQQELMDLIKKPHRSNHCFLCKRRVTKLNNSKEHVVPNWILSYMGINKKGNSLTVRATGRQVDYCSNKIACCLECNGTLLNKNIEDKISPHIKKGYDHVVNLYSNDVDFRQLYVAWMNLLYFKFFFSDLTRKKDITKKHSRKIITPTDLKDSFQLIYISLLQYLFPKKIEFLVHDMSVYLSSSEGERKLIKIVKDNHQTLIPCVVAKFPYDSHLFFKCNVESDSRLNFNLNTNARGSVLLQINDLGMLSFFNDYGFFEHGFSPMLNKLKKCISNNSISGTQFTDVLVHLICEKLLFFSMNGKYLVDVIDSKVRVVQFPIEKEEFEGALTSEIIGNFQKEIHSDLMGLDRLKPGEFARLLYDEDFKFIKMKEYAPDDPNFIVLSDKHKK